MSSEASVQRSPISRLSKDASCNSSESDLRCIAYWSALSNIVETNFEPWYVNPEEKSKTRDRHWARFSGKSRAQHCIDLYMYLCFGFCPGKRSVSHRVGDGPKNGSKILSWMQLLFEWLSIKSNKNSFFKKYAVSVKILYLTGIWSWLRIQSDNFNML